MRKYLLDENVFIEAHKRYYALDLVPGFWESLINNHKINKIFSIEYIKKKLEDYGDDLSKWIKSNLPATFFVSINTSTINWYGQMQIWANTQSQFLNAAKAEFASSNNTDCWLIACAKADNYVLVTHEVFNPNITVKIPIPNVCNVFGVDCINTFDMLRELKVELVLK